MPRLPLRPLLFSSLMATVMLFLCLFWLSLPRTFGDEAFFIKWTSLVKKTVLGIDPKPPAEDFLYVDVSRSKATLPTLDPLFEEYTGYSQVAITDRAQLAAFLNTMTDHATKVPLVLLDIYFQEPSAQDSLLQAAIDRLPFPIVGAAGEVTTRDAKPLPINLPTGVAMYLSVDENFMKYPLYFEDSLPTLPLLGLCAATGTTTSNTFWWPRLGEKKSLSNPIIDFKVRPYDFTGDQRYHLHEMGSLLFQFEFWEPEDIATLFNGKTVIIGDFEQDMHQTVFGAVPGPMIVHNTYLTLAEGESLIRWEWVIFLLALFFWMAWRVYHEEQAGSRSWLWRRSQTSFGRIVADSIDDTFFLVVGTILSYLIFNVHINILILLIFLKIVAFILRRWVFKHDYNKGA